MKFYKKSYLIEVFFLVLILACQSENSDKNNAHSSPKWFSPTLAKGFLWSEKADSLVLKTLGSEFNASSIQQVKKNPQSIVVLSSTFLPYLNALHLSNRIVATSEARYLSDSTLRARIQRGEVFSLNTQGQIDREWFIAHRPELILTYQFSSQDSLQIHTLKKLGLAVFVLQPFEENHPLGRVEWIKIFGALFDQSFAADSIYQSIAQRYDSLKVKNLRNRSNRPFVLSGSPFEGVWWVPGGRSLSAQLIEDAGGNYLFKEDAHKVAFPTDFETVLANAAKIDYWINTNPFTSLEQFTQYDQRLNHFKTLQKKQIFSHLKSRKNWGADDFYETGVFRPDWVLEDLIRIFRGEKETDDSLWHFYQQLQ